MNILVSPLPKTVDVAGASVAIRSGYRTGIQVARTADANLSDIIKASVILRLYFGEQVPDDTAAAFEAAMWFLRCGEDADAPSRRPGRLLDWDHDAGMILADFLREYGIDLASPATQMHWWAFLAYFRNLSNKSETKTAIYYRSGNRPRGIKGDEAKRYDEMRRMYALPPRTAAEAVADEAAKWGDA